MKIPPSTIQVAQTGIARLMIRKVTIAISNSAVITQHAASLRYQDFGSMQISGSRAGQQLLVGHAGPKEITQAAAQGVVGQRPHGRAGCLRTLRRARRDAPYLARLS